MIVDTHTHLFGPDPVRYPVDPTLNYRPQTGGSVELLKTQMADCLYGSNFPTAQYNPKATYQQTLQVFSEAMDLRDDERRWILGGTAARLWRWG